MRGLPLDEREQEKLAADLSAYLDGELSPERAADIERTLAASPEARRLLDELRDVADQLAALPRLRAPDELTAAMTRHAERRLLLDDVGTLRRTRTLRLWGRIGAAAAVLVACVFVGWEVFVRPAPQAPVAPPVVTRAPVALPDVASGGGPRADEVEKLGANLAEEARRARAHDNFGDWAAGTAASREATVALEEKAGVAAEVSQPLDATSSTCALKVGEAALADLGGTVQTVNAPVYYNPAAPTVDVWITPQSAQQYAAAAATLATWREQGQAWQMVDGQRQAVTEGLQRDDRAKSELAHVAAPTSQTVVRSTRSPAGPAYVAEALEVPADELYERISQLAAQVGDPRLVQYQITSTAADTRTLGYAWQAYAQKTDRFQPTTGGTATAARPAPPAGPGGLAGAAAGSLAGAPGAGLASGKAGSFGRSGSPKGPGPPTLQVGPRSAAKPATSAPAAPPARRGSDRKDKGNKPATQPGSVAGGQSERQARAPASPEQPEQTSGKTERPAGQPSYAPPAREAARKKEPAAPAEGWSRPTTQPATSQTTRTEEEDEVGALSQPATSAHEAAPSSPPHELLLSLLRYLLQATEAGTAQKAADTRWGEMDRDAGAAEAASHPAPNIVFFRVRLLPPPTASAPAATRPAAADRADVP